MPEAFPYTCTSHGTLPLVNCTYILDGGVVKGPLVRRGYILNKSVHPYSVHFLHQKS